MEARKYTLRHPCRMSPCPCADGDGLACNYVTYGDADTYSEGWTSCPCGGDHEVTTATIDGPYCLRCGHLLVPA